MNEGFVWTYDGPPVISGDPCCNKCGGTEFRWVGVCTKCYDKETNSNKEQLRLIEQQRKVWLLIDKHKERWEELKKFAVDNIPELHGKSSVVLDFLTGYGNALQDILDEMETLEEK